MNHEKVATHSMRRGVAGSVISVTPLILVGLSLPAHAASDLEVVVQKSNNSTSVLLSQRIEPSAQQDTQTFINTQNNYTRIEGGRQVHTNLFHQFDTFNVGTNATADFITSDSVQSVIGQVSGGNVSYIDGTLQVSGSDAVLYLINPTGILFGPNAQLNLGGSFTATTADQIEFGDRWLNTLSADDYTPLSGTPTAYHFSAEAPGAIVNQGNLTVAPNASLQLIGGSVINTGTLSAPAGDVTLSAQPGNSLVRLDATGSLLSVEVEPSTLPPQLTPLSLPKLLTGSPANIVSDIQVNDDGLISLVNTTTTESYALNVSAGALTNAGSIDASGNSSGDTSGDVSSQTGGTLNLLGNQVDVVESALSATGNEGGGLIRIGGNFQGKGPLPNAENVFVSNGTIAQADALSSGDGGQIIVWANGEANISGTFSANGAGPGTGGLVETSGLSQLTLGEQLSVSTDSPNGTVGTWLLDPIELTVVASGGSAMIPNALNEPTTATTLNAATLVTALDRNNVTLQATNTITVDAPVDVTGNSSINDLRLEAPTINLNAPLSFRPSAILSGTASTVNLGTNGTLLNGVSAVANDGTVTLGEGIYVASGVQIFRNVTLQGEGRDKTIIQGDNASRLFSISAGTTTLDGLTLENGTDTTGNSVGGGAIRVSNSASLNLRNSLVQNNSSSSFGGGIYLDGSGTSLIENTIIRNNSSGIHGGGVFSQNGHSLTLNNSLVTRNTAAANGGGVDGSDNSRELVILNSNIRGNQAQGRGGGVSVGNFLEQLRIENSTIANNQAIGDRGGGVHSRETPITILNTTFRGNEALATANGRGGAIVTRGAITIEDARFEENRAYEGGALLLEGDSRINGAIVDTTFDRNRASTQGGAIALQEGHQLSIQRTTLSNNIATGNGGAIAHNSNGALGLSISRSTLSGNEAGSSGGALYVTGSGNSTLSQTTLANNSAGTTGGGIEAIGNVSLRSTILAGNSAPYAPELSGLFTSLGNNIIQTRTGGFGYDPSDLPQGTDPLLGPLADNGGPTFTHALLPGSPAIEAGQTNNPSNTSDQRGVAITGIPDIGAYESTLSQIATALTFIAGGGQSTVVGTPFTIPLQAQVTDALGNGLPGISVDYYQAPGMVWDGNTAQVLFTGVTDANGHVSTPLTASTVAGFYTVRAETASGLFDDIVLTKLPDVASNLEVISGNNQTAEVSTTFATPLTVQVTDQYRNAIAQQAISFVSPPTGASSLLVPPSLLSDALGQATTTATANSIAGTYNIAATAAGLTNQFTLTNAPAPPVDPPIDPPVDPPADEIADPALNPPVVEPTPPIGESENLDSLTPFNIAPTQSPSSNESPLAEMLDNEEQQQNEGRVSFFDGVAFSQVERSLTEEYAKYWQKPLEGETSFEAIQQLLQTAEEQHQSKTAVVYALFVPSTEPNALADNRYPSVLSQRLLQNDVTNEDDQLMLMVIGPDGEPIQQLIDVNRKDITLQAALLGIEISSFIDDSYQPLARQLYSWLLAPIEDDLARAGIDNVMYVLDEGLRTVPLAAMMDDDGYAIENYGISMLPSIGLLQNEFGSAPAQQAVLAAGADTFKSQDALPAVPTELALVQAASASAEVLLNESFSIDNVTAAQQNTPRDIIHLATHAIFNSGSTDNSFIQFWNEKLTLNNLDTLGLEDLELLILSACTTALGNHQAELGFAGLAASLGVESSIGSLWNISDIGTMALMAEFYEQLRSQPLRFSALQQAQLALLQGDTRIENNRLITQNNQKTIPDNLSNTEQVDFSHPFFWSGFTLIGNPWW